MDAAAGAGSGAAPSAAVVDPAAADGAATAGAATTAGAAGLELASFTGLLLDAAGADDAAGAAGGFLVELLPLFWRFSLAGVSIPASVAMS